MNLRRLTACLTTASLVGAVGSALYFEGWLGFVSAAEHEHAGAQGRIGGVARLGAEDPDPLADLDDDLLPDSLEWVTLTDPQQRDTDRNGTDDFLQTVQHLAPGTTRQRPMQDEVRVLVSSARRGQETEIYLHMLFRFLGDRIGNVSSMTPFLTIGTTNPVLVPISELIGSGPVSIRSNYDPARGTYIALSARIARATDLAQLLPATIGAEAVIDNRQYTSGTYLTQSDNLQVALLPYDQAGFLAQPIDGGEGQNNPYWNSNSVCVLKMSVVGSGVAGSLCEVDAADCEVANGLRCAPSCRTSVGRLVFVPDGLSTLTGG